MTLLLALLLILILTNWCWFVFFTSYRNTIKKELAKGDTE